MKDPERQRIARAIVWRLIDKQDGDPIFMDLKEKFIRRNTRANLCVIGSIVVVAIVGTLYGKEEISPIWFLLLFIPLSPLLYFTLSPVLITDEEVNELIRKNRQIEVFDIKSSEADSMYEPEDLMID